MQSKLNELGIYLNSYSVGNYKTFCPKCKNTRKAHNTHDTPLSVTIENDKALFNCHNCEHTGIASENQIYQTVKKSNPDKLNTWFSKRGISQKTTEDLGIYEWNDNICFPYIQNGETKNIKYNGAIPTNLGGIQFESTSGGGEFLTASMTFRFQTFELL